MLQRPLEFKPGNQPGNPPYSPRVVPSRSEPTAYWHAASCPPAMPRLTPIVPRAHRAKPRLPYATPASPRLVPAPRLPARRLPARCLPCHHRLIASAPFPHAPGYSVARRSLPTLASRPRCLALRPRPTRSSTASARSTRRTTGTPSRYARAIATRMIVVVVATAPRQLASASVQPVLKGLDIELIERLVKGLGVPGLS